MYRLVAKMPYGTTFEVWCDDLTSLSEYIVAWLPDSLALVCEETEAEQ